MTIRPSTEQDIPAIVELLKLSLGESLMPKTEAFWRWKHLENPFGQSPVLLAVEDDRLIGVRAFMRWEWKQGETIFKAVRAVDTATHPAHQGKGIFKVLTTQLAEQCSAEGVHFIFNTPNKSSMPGYLKMGWQKNGRMPVFMRPLIRMANARQHLLANKFTGDLPTPPEGESGCLVTNRSPEFLMWRYIQNPNIDYYSFSNHDGLVIYRLKPNPLGAEFRMVDVFWNGLNQHDFNQLILRTANAVGANLITWAGNTFPVLSAKLSVGPQVTTRQLNGANSLSFDLWKPSIGDMEVF